ncbi:unnamed protein product [marine sediment metagenome]|uniref:Uncharacterized protein n=1 Tax=marine sediment metagenome TaxID=412755 RepID=X1J704_9ZZZZ
MSANFEPKLCEIEDIYVKTRGTSGMEDKIIGIGEDMFQIKENYRQHTISKWTSVGWKQLVIISTQTKGLPDPRSLTADAYHDKLWDKSYSIAKRFSKSCYR